MKLTAAHADTCLPSFWGGHHLPHVQVIVDKGMTFGALKRALHNELNEGALMGSNVGDDAWSSGPDGDAWYKAAGEAVDAITTEDPEGNDETPLFNDLEEEDEDEDDDGESVYAFFVFTEG